MSSALRSPATGNDLRSALILTLAFFAAGTAMRADDDQNRLTVATSMPYTDVDERHVLYEFNIERALWTTWSTPTSPNYQSWRCQPTS